MTLNLEPSQHAKLVKVYADSPRNTTRLLTGLISVRFYGGNSIGFYLFEDGIALEKLPYGEKGQPFASTAKSGADQFYTIKLTLPISCQSIN